MTVSSPVAPKPSTDFGVLRAAIAETMVVLAAALVVDQVWFDGTRFRDVAPHPFWLIVLVMAAHYGTAAGAFATVIGALVA